MHDIVTYSKIDGNLVCKFSGRLDTVVSQVIKDDVINHIQTAHIPTIFDLKGVEYISSSFLRVSISSARVAPNMKIKIINAIPDIKEIYETAGLCKIFIFESLRTDSLPKKEDKTLSIMNKKCFEDMAERGFFYQITDEEALRKILNESNVTFYVGFDPTADSLHVGHLLQVMVAKKLQSYGHKPIMLVGGATALVGDPTGKQEARPLLSKETVAKNAEAIKAQLSRFINFNDAYFVNNTDWFADMLYIDMLRNIGVHFSVNRMLSMDSVKQRMESGISFLEFNYMILQSYDFVYLNEKYNCELEVGGQDQWGNIVSGVELGRKLKGKPFYGATSPLLTDSSGQKFGKTAGNAVWLDKNRTSIFDYYQFWRNVDDKDVCKLLYLFTFLPSEEIESFKKLQAPKINRAKEILAYETTMLAHGSEEAKNAYVAAGTKFGFADPENKILTSSTIKNITISNSSESLPTYEISSDEISSSTSEDDDSSTSDGKWIVELFTESRLTSSNGEARRLIQGGGAYINDTKISDINYKVSEVDFKNGEMILKAGKKNIRRILIKD